MHFDGDIGFQVAGRSSEEVGSIDGKGQFFFRSLELFLSRLDGHLQLVGDNGLNFQIVVKPGSTSSDSKAVCPGGSCFISLEGKDVKSVFGLDGRVFVYGVVFGIVYLDGGGMVGRKALVGVLDDETDVDGIAWSVDTPFGVNKSFGFVEVLTDATDVKV
ncbi:MAG: hypothetical protein BWY72_00632 [Bacteroidetes bacterium ADurb.Bin416]|nr:MAG: hypothetical protein BWY72_00632 [Bacteroidetes bacterium ADurb.Bin416]